MKKTTTTSSTVKPGTGSKTDKNPTTDKNPQVKQRSNQQNILNFLIT